MMSYDKVVKMASEVTTSVFMSGRSQAVRIPKAFRVDAERMKIRKRGESLVLTPVGKEDQWASLKAAVEWFQTSGDNCLDAALEKVDWEGYPRMGFDESPEHFEARVHEYEKACEERERVRRAKHGE